MVLIPTEAQESGADSTSPKKEEAEALPSPNAENPAEGGKNRDRTVSAYDRRQGAALYPQQAPRGAGRDLLCDDGHGLLP